MKNVASFFKVDETFNSIQSPKSVIFNKSKKIAPYLYSLVAGPFSYKESNVEGMPPMKIYARQSVLKDIKPETYEEMFLVT